MNRWSYSRLQTLKCPKQYEYEYVLGVKPPPSTAMEAGSAVHAAFEAAVSQTSLSSVDAIVRRTLADEADKRKIDRKSVLRFYPAVSQVVAKIVMGLRARRAEVPVALDATGVVLLGPNAGVGHERGGFAWTEGARYVGFIDLLGTREDGVLVAADYKTMTASRVESFTPDRWEAGITQSSAYACLAAVARGHNKAAAMVIVLAGSQWDARAETLTDCAAAVRSITAACDDADARLLRYSQEGYPAVPGDKCRWCQVRSFCPAFTGPRSLPCPSK